MNHQTFMSKVHRFALPVMARNVELAYQLAKMIHKGQVRKELGPDRQPLRYFEHPRRVALILIDEAGFIDTDVLCAALLHDVIEDTDEIQLVSALLERCFGIRVARMVRMVSKAPKEGYLERLEGGLNVSEKSGIYMAIKAADRLDNLRSLPADDQAFCERQILETHNILLPLFAKAELAMPKEALAGYNKIVNKIRDLI